MNTQDILNIKYNKYLNEIDLSDLEIINNTTYAWTSERNIKENAIINFKKNTIICLNQNKVIFILNLDLLSISLTIIQDKNIIKIQVLSSDIVFYIQAKEKEVFDNIVVSLHIRLSISKGFNRKLIGLCLIKEYYLNRYISINNFEQVAETGDILIFKGRELSSKLQRFFTKNEYDHVAIIIKTSYRLEIYESNGNCGVKLRSWNDYIANGWINSFDKIVYRKLLYNENKNESIKNLIYININEFITCTENKSYSLPLKSILCNNKFNKENKDWKNYKGFFCSQLVAAALIQIGVLKSLRSTAEYLPGDFSSRSKKKLDFIKGFEYSEETILDTTDYLL